MIKLNQLELSIVETYNGIKSFARKESILREMSQSDMDNTIESLIQKKIIRRSKNGATALTSDYEKTKLLIAFNKTTKDEVQNQINLYLSDIETLRAELKTVPQIRSSWPNPPSHFESLQDEIQRETKGLTFYSTLLKLF